MTWRFPPVWLFLSAAVLHSSAVWAASSWGVTFQPEPLASYIDSTAATILVAGAGADSKDATQSLIDGLRKARSVSLVTDAAALGNVSDASDADIVKKADGQPVNIVAVVRVFPSGDDRPSTAVVTFYSRTSGSVLSALTAQSGTVLVPRRAQGQAAPPAALDSISQVVQQSPHLTYQELIEQRGIWTVDGALIDDSVKPGTFDLLLKGKDGVRIGGAELFNYIGQHKLAQEYQNRMVLKGWLGGGGAIWILTVGITFAALIALPGPCIQSDSFGCVEHGPNYPMIGTAIAVNALGLGAIIAALVIDPSPVNHNEQMKLIGTFNDKVKADAKGSAATETSEWMPAITWNVAPAAGPNFSGLVLRVGW